jgi:hypothetical protein
MRPEHWLYTIPLRLRSLFRGSQTDHELDDELRDHLERKTEEYVATGMATEEARRRARLDLGGFEQTKEKCREARRVNWIQDCVQDLRYGTRAAAQIPGIHDCCRPDPRAWHRRNTAIFTNSANLIERTTTPSLEAPQAYPPTDWRHLRGPVFSLLARHPTNHQIQAGGARTMAEWLANSTIELEDRTSASGKPNK